jgi:hypothetical protein
MSIIWFLNLSVTHVFTGRGVWSSTGGGLPSMLGVTPNVWAVEQIGVWDTSHAENTDIILSWTSGRGILKTNSATRSVQLRTLHTVSRPLYLSDVFS